jgi:hypothetical protein
MKSCKVAVIASVISLPLLGCRESVGPGPKPQAPTADSIRELLAETQTAGLVTEMVELGRQSPVPKCSRTLRRRIYNKFEAGKDCRGVQASSP